MAKTTKKTKPNNRTVSKGEIYLSAVGSFLGGSALIGSIFASSGGFSFFPVTITLAGAAVVAYGAFLLAKGK